MSDKKTAILITGELRTIYKTCKLLKKNLIDRNNADVFVYADVKPRDKALLEKHNGLEGYYKHIWGDSVKVVAIYSDSDKAEYAELKTWLLKHKRAISRDKVAHCYDYMVNGGTIVEYFMLYKCGRLMMDYENAEGVSYDYVMRCRNDVLITREWDIPGAMEEASNTWLPHLNYPAAKIDYCKFTGLPFVYVFRGNVVWFTTRQVACSIFNMIFCYGDNMDPKNWYSWNAETQFELFVESQGAIYLDHRSKAQEKYLVSKCANTGLFKNTAVRDGPRMFMEEITTRQDGKWELTDKVDPELHITIVRLDGYAFDKD